MMTRRLQFIRERLSISPQSADDALHHAQPAKSSITRIYWWCGSSLLALLKKLWNICLHHLQFHVRFFVFTDTTVPLSMYSLSSSWGSSLVPEEFLAAAVIAPEASPARCSPFPFSVSRCILKRRMQCACCTGLS